jgi:hypothetical protein
MGTIEKEAKDFIVPETEDEEKEIFEEFYPENIIEGEAKKEAMTTEADAKTTGSEAVKATNKKPVAAEEDKLLGKATRPEVVKKEADHLAPYNEPASVDEFDIIGKDQLKVILDLKVNLLKINDQKAWASLIKGMKFGKDVKKANDMTVLQGDQFIETLKALVDVPF